MSTEFAWAAGFFDGEGCTSQNRTRTGTYLELSIQQADPRPLRRFVAAVQAGRFSGPHPPSGLGRKPRYRWRLTKRTEIHAVMARMWPYLSEPKREQALAKGVRREEFLA